MVKVYMEGEPRPVKTYNISDLEIIPKQTLRQMSTTGAAVAAFLRSHTTASRTTAALQHSHTTPAMPGGATLPSARRRHSMGEVARFLVRTHGRVKAASWNTKHRNVAANQIDENFEYVVDPNDSQFRFFVIAPSPKKGRHAEPLLVLEWHPTKLRDLRSRVALLVLTLIERVIKSSDQGNPPEITLKSNSNKQKKKKLRVYSSTDHLWPTNASSTAGFRLCRRTHVAKR